jgi:hypothetical protein
MARAFTQRDTSAVVAAAETWINKCLIEDGSVFSSTPRWTAALIDEVHQAFVEHPDVGADDFMTKLKGQMVSASAPAQQLMAELMWALVLFPSNMRPLDMLIRPGFEQTLMWASKATTFLMTHNRKSVGLNRGSGRQG